MWASTKSRNKLPTLEKYLVHATAINDTPEGKARRLLGAVRVLSEQFGIPIRQGGQPVPVK